MNEMGYDVLGPVPDGQAALDLARQDRPDLALLDIEMTGMNGLDAAKQLFDELAVPTVIVTAHSDDERAARATEIGVFGYVVKPTSAEALHAAIRVAWSRFIEQRELVDKVAQLERKLEERKLIERAKGVLMQRLGLSEPEAMRRLQKQARDARRPMAELAKALLDTEDLFGEKG